MIAALLLFVLGIGICLYHLPSVSLLRYPIQQKNICCNLQKITKNIQDNTAPLGKRSSLMSVVKCLPKTHAHTNKTFRASLLDHKLIYLNLSNCIASKGYAANSYKPPLPFNVGDKIYGLCDIFPIRGPKTYYGFDFKKYCYLQKIVAMGKIIRIDKIQKQAPSFLNRVRLLIQERIYKVMDPKTGSIACALTIGDRSAIPMDFKTGFSNTGLSHILAISGLHMSIIIGFIFILFRKALAFTRLADKMDTRKITAVLSIIVGFFYLAISGWGVPAKRALLMACVFMGGLFLNRQAFSIRTLSLCAFIILLSDPLCILSLSFALSFAAVFGLITFCPLSLFPYKTQKYWQKLVYGILCIFQSTCAANLATAPFLIASFYQISLHSFWTNLLAIPLTTFLIMPLGFISILIPWDFLLHLWEFTIKGLIFLATTPTGGTLTFCAPPPFFLTIAIVSMILMHGFGEKFKKMGYIIFFMNFFSLTLKHHLPSMYLTKNTACFCDHTQNVIKIYGKRQKFLEQEWSKEQGIARVIPMGDFIPPKIESYDTAVRSSLKKDETVFCFFDKTWKKRPSFKPYLHINYSKKE